MKNLALIGAGYWGRNLARNFHELGALAMVCDASDEVLAAQSAACPGIRVTKSVEEVMSDASITRVAIAAPAVRHFDLALRALQSGKDVFVEKPLALDVREGLTLVDLAEKHGRILMVGHLLQYHPCVRAIQRLVAEGELGKLQYITSNRLNLGKIRREENALWSFAPHDISVVLSLVGGEMPERVRCIGEAYLNNGVADVTLTTMSFPGGVNAHVHVSWINPFKEQRLTVVGSHGMLVFDDTLPWEEKVMLYRQPLVWQGGTVPTAKKAAGEAVVVPQEEPLRLECAHFLECCDERKAPVTDGQEGLRVLEVLNAAQRSLDGGGEAASPESVSVGSAQRSYQAHPTAVIDPDAKIGSGTKIWHFSHVMAGAEVGEKCNIGQNVVVSPGVKLGRNVKIQNNVSIYTGVICEDDVFLGPSMVFTNISNPRSAVVRRDQYVETLVRRGASIGANATIVCGNELGEYCLVGAGAVVTKPVKAFAVVAGNPARQLGWVSRHGEKLPLAPDGEGDATCPATGEKYEVRGGACRQVD
jgi:UDP-2-acetamido-3-amino-2,3-dideoxy-glucuronate N-acetyltransferase